MKTLTWLCNVLQTILNGIYAGYRAILRGLRGRNDSIKPDDDEWGDEGVPVLCGAVPPSRGGAAAKPLPHLDPEPDVRNP